MEKEKKKHLHDIASIHLLIKHLYDSSKFSAAYCWSPFVYRKTRASLQNSPYFDKGATYGFSWLVILFNVIS